MSRFEENSSQAPHPTVSASEDITTLRLGDKHLFLGLWNFKILSIGLVRSDFKIFPQSLRNWVGRVDNPIPLPFPGVPPAQAVGPASHESLKDYGGMCRMQNDQPHTITRF